MEETTVPGETHRPDASHWQTFSHNVISRTLVVIGTDYTASSKSNYQTMTTTTPLIRRTDRSMANRKRTKWQTMVYKTLHENHRWSSMNSTKSQWWTHVGPVMILFTTPVISHQWRKDRIVLMTTETYPWSFVTQIFRSG